VRYWWVNQNQTYRQEIEGGYLWSPKRNANGARNPFYEFMREVAPGDLVFSFVDTRIAAIGTVASYCYESPKPAEFGGVGLNWEAIGWRVRVNFVSLLNKIRPKDHIDVLRRVLPSRYSPLQDSGNGIQSVYLTEVPMPFAEVLIGLIGKEAALVSDRAARIDTPDTHAGRKCSIWKCGSITSSPRSNLIVNFQRPNVRHSSWRDGDRGCSSSGSCKLKPMQNHGRHESDPSTSQPLQALAGFKQ
jgi:hypothetical protein